LARPYCPIKSELLQFNSAKIFAAFLGVTPKQRSSGTSIKGRTMCAGQEATPCGQRFTCPAWSHADTTRYYVGLLNA
jgi:hypothetical protein